MFAWLSCDPCPFNNPLPLAVGENYDFLLTKRIWQGDGVGCQPCDYILFYKTPP